MVAFERNHRVLGHNDRRELEGGTERKMGEPMEAPDRRDDREPGRFYRPGTGDPARIILEQLEPSRYRLIEPFEYVDRLGVTYLVPLDVDAESNNTDLASIPPFLTWLVPKDGRHTPAAILHDALIGGVEGTDYQTSTAGQVSDAHADYVFREAMRDLEVRWLRRWLMWAAVALRTASYRHAQAGPELRLLPVALTALATLILAVFAGLMALDVPDLGSTELSWLGARPWYSEIIRALGQILLGGLGFACVLVIVYRSTRIFGAGLLGGLTIGFFGLPMIASLVGATGYLLLERLISRAKT